MFPPNFDFYVTLCCHILQIWTNNEKHHGIGKVRKVITQGECVFP